ncbi:MULTISPECIES: ATP-binding SpoIIE family protein phosphatase [unclassified Streptomyces]|uniref:ATP-binding SpoIIE family protein phosphatase n=1 Tax=unclassified Streptomyces TaxID=2593676 RepID=UPI002E15763D|nr:SpoIIE family protein phosphatase [Streptomyces sp. NBC_01207]WTA22403.1 SpoIIE family protein phosphatase [Streptomyces sp. NBC_00853]
MREPEHRGPGPASGSVSGTAAVVLDDAGVVIARSEGAATLLECPPGQICAPLLGMVPRAGTGTGAGPVGHLMTVPGGDHTGHKVPLVCTVVRLAAHAPGGAGAATQWLVLVTPAETAEEAAERDARRRRTGLAQAAAAGIGTSLDVIELAETLVNLLVPDFADLATVDIAENVLVGDEPPHFHTSGDVRLRRTSAAQSPEISAEDLLAVGEALPPVTDSSLMRPLMEGLPVLVPDVAALQAELGVDPNALPLFVPSGAHSSVAMPLYARGLILGCVTVWRSQLPSAFGEEDAALLKDVVSRAALGVDNARRYTKEHRSVVTLQRSLLPRSALDSAAAETVGVYQPAGGGSRVGGDWFDVIPLPSLRVAFVVGDVVGHGLDATAAMARLRTAVQTLADLDLDPGELLTHLDDLVLGFSEEQMTSESHAEHAGRAERSEPAVLGATCLYAVYDPVTGRCATAAAGHPPPVLLPPDGEPVFLGVTPGPPLGVGGVPFEVTEFGVRPGSMLAFFTDGLVASRGGDIDEGMERLRGSFAGSDPRLPLDELSRAVFDGVRPQESVDDAALLLARIHALPPDQLAEWELEADLSLVAHARELVVGQLSEWQLDEMGFVTELVASELVTNAIRYAGGPIGLRLIRDRVLVCEVSDPSSTQPRLRRARETDEGGRGLFLVAQLADRWGCRFTGTGKTIWTEQPIGGSLG